MIEKWIGLLGPFAYPLGLCSLLLACLVVERLLFYARLPRVSEIEHTVPRDNPSRRLAGALHLLRDYRDAPRAERDEHVTLWLRGYARSLTANHRWIGLIAALTPMFGLLGTVLGMTRAFQSIAGHSGPVSPQVLSGGIWEAMLTTLVGLTLAVPALVALQIFKAIASEHLEKVTVALNRASLAIAKRPAEDSFASTEAGQQHRAAA